MNIRKELEDIKARFDKSGALSPDDKIFIESYFERITQKGFSKRGCNSCYADAFIEMYTHYKKYGIKIMGKFKLKRGVVLHFGNKVYTNANLTDEIAEKYLKEFPKQEKLFETTSGADSEKEKVVDTEAVKALTDEKTKLEGKVNELDAIVQQYKEGDLVNEIAGKLKEGQSKTSIREHYKEIKEIWNKPLTGALLNEFIKSAEALNSK